MTEFYATGTVTLNGVIFFIEAASMEEAKERFRKGEFDHYDEVGAETSDWEIRESTTKADQ